MDGCEVSPKREDLCGSGTAVDGTPAPERTQSWRWLARRVLWPTLVIGFSAAYAVQIAAGGHPIRLGLLGAVVITCLILLERLLPHRSDWGTRGDAQLPNDLAHTLLGAGIGAGCIESLVIAAAAYGLLPLPGDSVPRGLWPTHWPLALQVAGALILADGLYYWKHRLLHRIPRLWKIHAIHHSADRLHTLKATRSHFVEAILRALLIVAPLVALGVPREVLLWYSASIVIIVPLSHANLDVCLPSWTHWWLQTPQWHRLHHAADPALANTNFASLCPLWDVIFGTFAHPDEAEANRVGLPDEPLPTHLIGQLWYPFSSITRPRDSDGGPVGREPRRNSTASFES